MHAKSATMKEIFNSGKLIRRILEGCQHLRSFLSTLFPTQTTPTLYLLIQFCPSLSRHPSMKIAIKYASLFHKLAVCKHETPKGRGSMSAMLSFCQIAFVQYIFRQHKFEQLTQTHTCFSPFYPTESQSSPPTSLS